MKLQATASTKDGRLTAGKVYTGQIVFLPRPPMGDSGIRFACFDNKRQWMTFAVKVFVPVDGGE